VMEHLGWPVLRLIRLSYGPFQLGDLKEGEVEEVKARVLAEQLGATKPKGTGAAKAKAKKPYRGKKPRPAEKGKPRAHNRRKA
jgi:23S rRNA pseudouridine2605 synthase